MNNDSINLNKIPIRYQDDQGKALSELYMKYRQTPRDILLKNVMCRLVRDNIREELIEYISGKDYDLVVGCVAWAGDYDILNALREVPSSLVINKEDWFRPDANGRIEKDVLRNIYDSMNCNLTRSEVEPILCNLNICDNIDKEYIEPIRCCGITKSAVAQKTGRPNMHHKFLVFCKYDTDIEPISLWNGSYNFSLNSRNSIENVMIFESPEMAREYYIEWQYTYALSEPLDWNYKYMQPEYSIGE